MGSILGLVGKIFFVLLFSYLAIYPKDGTSDWGEIWTTGRGSTLSIFARERVCGGRFCASRRFGRG